MLILSLLISLIITVNSGVCDMFYPDTGYVTNLSTTDDIVYYEDFEGCEWSFYGVEDWMIDDQISVIMFNNFTPNYIYDDVIISARYTGWR